MFGDDFSHPQASKSYELMDAIIKQVEMDPNYIISYSTVDSYIKGIQKDARDNNIVFPVHTQDLFPHATDMKEYWNGYYTTNPFIKKTIR